jgi:hypothetical protein
VITARSVEVTTAPVPGDKVVLAELTMGGLTAHTSTLFLTGMAARRGHLDASVIFAAGARIVDFTGYYVCGPDNSVYAGQPVYEGKSASPLKFVTWDPLAGGVCPPGVWRLAALAVAAGCEPVHTAASQ